MSAAAALRGAVRQALAGIAGLGVHDLRPVQASFPHAQVDLGPDSDWGHKSGAGREIRLAVVVRERGEAPDRVEALAAGVEAAVCAVDAVGDGWQLVGVRHLRTRLAREPQGWAASVEFRVRMLRA